MSTEGIDPVAWLEKLQKDHGITYTQDTEDRLRADFAALCQQGAEGRVLSVTYWGYREEPSGDGGTLRTTLRELHAEATMQDGTRYHLKLIGPYNAAPSAHRPYPDRSQDISG